VLLLHDSLGWDLPTATAVHETAGLVLAVCFQALRGHSISRRLLLSQLSFNLSQTRAATEFYCRLKPKGKQAG